ncbi:lipocalin family protein [Phenylobacterium immobile]|uniref:lipocalin family protein n=1 Tax=Phenylobacterium immobile TaxID=21 RepID=UPI000A848A8B|nr:lipocalin family protein [Phenylobacterium immobile]
MFSKFLTGALAGFSLLAAAQSASAMSLRPVPRLELSQMMGRWYEVARTPNALQRNCQAGASEWTPAQGGFAVVQSCRKGAANGPLAQWKAKATVADPSSNARFKMVFFGGMVSQDYVVLEHKDEQGWLILATANGKYLWLMSQRPTLASAVRAQAIQRIRQLGFDPARLEFPPAS